MNDMLNLQGDGELCFTVPIPPVTKKNHGRIGRNKKGRVFLPSEAYCKYEDSAKPFLYRIFYQMKGRTIDYPINLKCKFYLREKRWNGDLVGYLQAIQDLLVAAGILEDDNRNIVASTDGSEVLYDKENPRTEITITKKEDYEQWVPKKKK